MNWREKIITENIAIIRQRPRKAMADEKELVEVLASRQAGKITSEDFNALNAIANRIRESEEQFVVVRRRRVGSSSYSRQEHADSATRKSHKGEKKGKGPPYPSQTKSSVSFSPDLPTKDRGRGLRGAGGGE